MSSKYIEINEIIEAYRKLKSYVYYDSYNLNLRIKLAEFESKNKDKSLFKNLVDNINCNKIDEYIDSIDAYILPKKIVRKSEPNNIVRNDACSIAEEIILQNNEYNFYLDAPIEIHLLDILWIMNEGCRLIDDNIKSDCYGNALIFHETKPNEIKKGSYLFNRYFDKYQKWRDNGIKIAKEQTKYKNDVLLVCLDIQRFYPTSRINFQKLQNALKKKGVDTFYSDILSRIYCKYQSILNAFNHVTSDEPQLPIGLLSSGVIANWYLSDFDISMKEKFNPIYYGRYVDDIFMVLGNVRPKDENDWFDKKFLYGEDSPLIISTANDTGSDESKNVYTLRTHPNLRINNKKIKLFYFSSNHSLAILDNFQKTLDEDSSAFWFLPEDDENETLSSKGFDIIYEDTINKFREISGVKNNKYGVSVFLTKQIKRQIISRDNKSLSIRDEIFKYFTGDRLIEMYSLWEKVFTFFVVIDDKNSFKQFKDNILIKIENISIKLNEKCDNLLRESLKKHLAYSVSMALSLNIEMNELAIEEKLSEILRDSYLIRQHYMPFPIIIYTSLKEKNLITLDLLNILIGNKEITLKENAFTFLNPRKIHTHELCLLNFINYINSVKSDDYINNLDQLIKQLKEIGLFVNQISFIKDKILFSSNNQEQVIIPKINCITENRDIKCRCKIALSNIKINEQDLICGIKEEPNFNDNKRERHFHLLNSATHEKVDCLILPEVSMPKELLVTYAEHSRRKQQLIIAGLEHIVSNNICYNFSVIFFLSYFYHICITGIKKS